MYFLNIICFSHRNKIYFRAFVWLGVRTHASKILKKEVETDKGIDSDTTIIVESVKKPKQRKPRSRKATRHNKKDQKIKTVSNFEARTYMYWGGELVGLTGRSLMLSSAISVIWHGLPAGRGMSALKPSTVNYIVRIATSSFIHPVCLFYTIMCM